MYSWESGGTAPQRKKVKKTGTVIFRANESTDTSFEKLLKPIPLSHDASENFLTNFSSQGDEAQQSAPLITAETVKVLTSRKGLGFTQLLPAQAQCYRGIFKGRDAILHSRTGTGKTLAYALPIIERQLIFSGPPSRPKKGAKKKTQSLPSPFMLIFVFSNELAHQTKDALDKIYGSRGLRICIAGSSELIEDFDILIGTVASVDTLLRSSSSNGSDGESKVGEKRPRDGRVETNQKPDGKNSENDEESNTDEDDVNDSDDDELEEQPRQTTVSSASVRAVVIDEVDLTLGPRFSHVGRRMKLLLRHVRRANGALQPTNLMSDFRKHHYVLCGATIPNWVIKAGFLGDKKYYYRLVGAGDLKLPDQLECFTTKVDDQGRIRNMIRLIEAQDWGRVVVFGNARQIDKLEVAMNEALNQKSGHWNDVKGVKSLSRSKDEVERISNIADYNSGSSSILLCTDVAARGLDFVDVHVVFILSFPQNPVVAAETFVHRAGRTARINKAGSCVVLVDNHDQDAVRAVESATHVTFRNLITGADKKTQGTAEPHVRHSLTVKSFLGKSPSSSGASSTAESVLRVTLEGFTSNGVEGDLMTALVHDLKIISDTCVTFATPAKLDHILSKKLWKYTLKTISQ